MWAFSVSCTQNKRENSKNAEGNVNDYVGFSILSHKRVVKFTRIRRCLKGMAEDFDVKGLFAEQNPYK